jgi:drug/metabolite transporter superfamily protein YnfA
MKGFILTTIILSVPLAGLAYWMFKPRFLVVRARLGRAFKVAGGVYLAIIAYRLATSNISQTQLDVAGLTLAFFGGVWVLAWIVTRALAK